MFEIQEYTIQTSIKYLSNESHNFIQNINFVRHNVFHISFKVSGTNCDIPFYNIFTYINSASKSS